MIYEKDLSKENNMELNEIRTPEIVAAEIRQIADQTKKMVLNNSIEIGKRLCEAKEMVPHGEWGEWLEKSVRFKQSTANNLMKIYQEYGNAQGELWGASAKSQTFGNLTYTKAVALLAIPEEEREEFIETNYVEDMSTRELQEAIKARDEEKQRNLELSKEIARAETEAIKAEQDIKSLKNKLKEEKENTDKRLKNYEQEYEEKAAAYKKEIALLKSELEAAESNEELEESQLEIARLERKLEEVQTHNENIARFKIYFNLVQDNFLQLLSAAENIEDEAIKASRKDAVKVLLAKLMEAASE